ncbi:sigma 54-interacting transcriptional regulator [Vagococcus sp. BWB3-3]|uniref:Sigma 54-interacting transcriptional regulator n=1 Tax=Vagococcus allomyrinae TaxID=2794353 RepID=A0A940PF65_9ENTE|nr:sigma 54-interacting transcriptional regulator [Vagococcus allomyrinae]MBP1042858.1 sigma 54-interacting transcriptional regulator [Vagococcus allomyrinae]
MRRIEKVLVDVELKTRQLLSDRKSDELTKGITAVELSESLAIARNSISQDLNQLVAEKKVIKIKSRPVLFFEKKILEEEFEKTLPVYFMSLAELNQTLFPEELVDLPVSAENDQQAFAQIIGSEGSLKSSIEKMKAAVLYPPNGLNLLIGGESGVGKTAIAEALHQSYDDYLGVATPFVYFNCAEYYNNPELLTSQLFGYAKGSFTGAESDRLGLVESADKGFLFLDEVHRLPSEGQEKLFTILDKGYFSRVGDVAMRKVTIRFIFATTEPFEHTFLRTFLRRIPVAITLPSLNERPINEKIQLVLSFFQNESNRIKKNMVVSHKIVEHFIFKQYSGNVGQMKSEVQFICAQSYLKQMNSQDDLIIDKVHGEPEKVEKDANDMLIVNKLLQGNEIVIQTGNDSSHGQLYLKQESFEEDLFYRFLLREYSNLKNSNIPETETAFILEKKLEQLYDMQLFSEEQTPKSLMREMDESFTKKIEQVCQFIEKETGFQLSEQLKQIMSKHLYATLIFIEVPDDDFYEYSSQLMLGKMENYQLAAKIVDYLSDLFNLAFPKTEVTYFGLLLRKLTLEQNNGVKDKDCGIVVIAHGETTATSMVEYCNTLFATNLLKSIDMPIYQSVEDTLEKLRATVRSLPYKRLILLVDIGSLVYFGNLISEEFEMEVLLIKNINLLTLLELSREVLYESTDFNYLLPIMNEKNHETSLCKRGQFNDRRVIIVSCMTGLGTAIKIEKLLIETFKEEILTNIRIVTLENKEIQSIEKIHQYVFPDERLVGIVGNMPTEIPDIPFISLEELFSEKGVERLLFLFGFDLTKQDNLEIKRDVSQRYMQMLSVEAITNYINVLNPQRLTVEVKEIYKGIDSQLRLQGDDKIMLRFLIHCCCTIERLVIDNSYNMTEYEVSYKDMPDEASVIKMAFRPLEVSYGIQFSPLEIKYIYELLYG